MVRRIDDIDNEKNNDFNKSIREDIGNLINGVVEDFEDLIKRKKIEKEIKEKNKKKSWIERFFYILYFAGIVGLVILIINFLLANIWLLRFFVRSLFL